MDKGPNNKKRFSLQGIRDALQGLGLSSVMLIVATAIALVAVGTLAWVSENRNTDAGGAQMNMEAERYTISFLQTTNQTDSILLNLRPGLSDAGSNTLDWIMTESSNMENLNGREGIDPGSAGVISFQVTPKTESVTLNLAFELLAYVNAGTEASPSLAPMQSDIANYLNGHIMLFRHRTGTPGHYLYYDPILPDASGDRVIRSFPCGAANQSTPVFIYWVWPNTLSTILDVYSVEPDTVSIMPFYPDDASGRTAKADVLENVRDYPGYYLKDAPSPDSSVDANTYLTSVAGGYSFYGDCYDRADNDIGNSIHFVLVRMTVSESEA